MITAKGALVLELLVLWSRYWALEAQTREAYVPGTLQRVPLADVSYYGLFAKDVENMLRRENSV